MILRTKGDVPRLPDHLIRAQGLYYLRILDKRNNEVKLLLCQTKGVNTLEWDSDLRRKAYNFRDWFQAKLAVNKLGIEFCNESIDLDLEHLVIQITDTYQHTPFMEVRLIEYLKEEQ